MSINGRLISYENDKECRRSKPKVSAAEIAKNPQGKWSKNRSKVHVNCLWSAWYGLCLTAFQAYLATQCAKRFLGYASLPWPVQPPPRLELNAYLAFLSVSVIALPFFLISAVFKVGNLANDGFKLGRNLSTCTADPPGTLLGTAENQGVFRSLWQHGGPTASFLHLSAAFCLLLPKLMMEARLIHAGFLPRDSVWKTDLDFLIENRDRLIVLNFMTSPPPFSNATFASTSHSFSSSSSADSEELTSLPIGRGTKDLMVTPFLDNSVLGSISLEFLNYATALMVYSVRYPSVFWNTNKWFGTLFSFQLLGNSIQSLLSFAGISVLYKVQIAETVEALPIFKKSSASGSPFLLDAYFTLGLFVLSSILVFSSSLVLYLYGYGRFDAFLNAERERIGVVAAPRECARGGWGYFTHCAALSVLLALAVCQAPLLHDCTVVYRLSLDGAVLSCAASAILHLFVWVSTWLVLTVKQEWTFRLRVTIGRAAVRSARSVKLVTDVDLVSSGGRGDDVTSPLLVVGGGRTYTVDESSPKRAIINVVRKAAEIERKRRTNCRGNGANNDDDDDDDDDAEIYWLRPNPRSADCSPSDSDGRNWFGKKCKSSQKQKVTFDDPILRGASSDSKGRSKSQMENSSGLICDDDGDYATLRVGPSSIKARTENHVLEEKKLLEHVLQDDSVTFARSGDLQPDREDPSPLLTPEPNEMPPPPPDANRRHAVSVHNNVSSDKTAAITPKCLRRADSGMPHEELTPRSGSVSSGSQSGSGSSPPGAQSSESSSGIHSNASSRRATSVDDLAAHHPEPRQTHWKSCSLQRNVFPQQIYQFSGQNLEKPPATSVVSAVILENPGEDTVVIRRKSSRPLTADLSRPPEMREEPFGRSTNMRMTSFTDEGNSATLPHFPTQAPPSAVVYPCNTMPLPCPQAPPPAPPLRPLARCTAFPTRPHTTIPIHHNGVRLFPTGQANKLHGCAAIPRLPRPNRDSANFSMASSNDSDFRS